MANVSRRVFVVVRWRFFPSLLLAASRQPTCSSYELQTPTWRRARTFNILWDVGTDKEDGFPNSDPPPTRPGIPDLGKLYNNTTYMAEKHPRPRIWFFGLQFTLSNVLPPHGPRSAERCNGAATDQVNQMIDALRVRSQYFGEIGRCDHASKARGSRFYDLVGVTPGAYLGVNSRRLWLKIVWAMVRNVSPPKVWRKSRMAMATESWFSATRFWIATNG